MFLYAYSENSVVVSFKENLHFSKGYDNPKVTILALLQLNYKSIAGEDIKPYIKCTSARPKGPLTVGIYMWLQIVTETELLLSGHPDTNNHMKSILIRALFGYEAVTYW